MDSRASKKRKNSGTRAVRRQALQPEEPNVGAELAEAAQEEPIGSISQLETGKRRNNRTGKRRIFVEEELIETVPESNTDAPSSSRSPQTDREQHIEMQADRPRKQSKKRKVGSAIAETEERGTGIHSGPKRTPRATSASSKAKVISQTPSIDPTHAEMQVLRKENARLQKEVESKDAALNAQKETISYIYGQCTCTVCMELVWRPHVLSPCGHVFCARCLVAWFTKPLAEEYTPQMDDAEEQRAAERRRTLRRVKICPHCRERVSVAPAEVWLIKGLVEKIDSSMRKGQGNEEHLVKGLESFAGLSEQATREAKGGNLPASKIIWSDIFLEERKNEPMFDEEDRVYRCTFCANEVVNGACTSPSCGMLYNIGHLLGIDSDESFLDEDYSDDDLRDLTGEDEEDDGFIDDGPIEVYDSEDEAYFARHNIGDHQRGAPNDEGSVSSSSSSVEEITAPHRVPRLARQISSDSDSSLNIDRTHITIDDETDYESDGGFDGEEELSDLPTGEDTHGEMEEVDEDDVDDDEAEW